MLPWARCDHLLRAKRFIACRVFLHANGCQAVSSENFRLSTEFSKERLFLPGSNDEGTDRDNHFASRVPTFYLDESRSDTAPDSAIDQFSTNSWNAIQPASSQWSRDDASTHRTLLCGGSGVTTPQRSTRGPTPSTIRRNDSYVLSPSRITGFIRRSGPYVQDHSTIDDSTIDPHGLASHGRKIPVTSALVDPGDLKDTVDDPLAEFDRWLASGAVEIIPD